MRKLEVRAATVVRAAQRRKISEIARELGEQGVQAQMLDDAVVLTGKGLMKRWLAEASLRFMTGFLR